MNFERKCGDDGDCDGDECGDNGQDRCAEGTNIRIRLIRILNIMKVHRIITTIEVENDNSITSIELTKLYPASDCILLAITNMTTNGNADDISKMYAIVDNHRFDIGSKLKDIARIIDESLNSHKRDEITDDNTINEINDDSLL